MAAHPKARVERAKCLPSNEPPGSEGGSQRDIHRVHTLRHEARPVAIPESRERGEPGNTRESGLIDSANWRGRKIIPAFAGVAIKGHALPGSPDHAVTLPNQLMSFGCDPLNSFTWGEEVLKFFMAYEKP